MDDTGFREYLKRNGANTEPGRNTRVHAVRKIEASLSELGSSDADLEAAYRTDRFEALRQTIKSIRTDALAGGKKYRVLMPESENPKNRLASWNSWLAQYGRFLASRDDGDHPDERFSAGMEKLRDTFLQRMPGFEDLSQEEGEFWDVEKRYKQEAHGAVVLAAGYPDQSDEERGRATYKRLSQATAQGLPLSWRTQGEVDKADPAVRTRFYETIAGLARLGPDDLGELETQARELEELRTGGIAGLKRGEVLGIAISVFGTVNPSAACWFKVRTFDRLANLLLGRKLFMSAQFEIEDFEEFQTFLFRIRDVLSDWGWRPDNLSDVQGFVWVAMAETWGDEDKVDLTREAIEAAMNECESIGVDAFLAKYQFGRPRDYWARRNAAGMLFPAKATVGAAHGFMPGGAPKNAKEFYGGFGEQAANGILQKLGFEIVATRGAALANESSTINDAEGPPTNLILYGPPGTGKTYATAAIAVELCGEDVPPDRGELMTAYRRLCDAKRIEFVTFHQSMAYEDFVEGKQPVTGGDDGDAGAGFRLETIPGIFRRIARRAETSLGHSAGPDAITVGERQVFKTSIGEAANPEDAYLFEEAIADGHTLLGFEDIDWSDEKYSSREAIIEACREQGVRDGDLNALTGRVQMPLIFRNWVKPGDLIIVSKGNGLFRAIGEVTGEYEFHPRPEGGYAHRRSVRWLWVDRDGVPVSEIYQRKFSMRTIYVLTKQELNIPALERYINSQRPDAPSAGTPDPFVLIIDEINRANISKVFGELITLLEPDKRLGQPNELKVRLPYSEDEFGVPANLHIVGTMNTADRSIALLDTALRRRFEFRELMPDPSVLQSVGGIDLPKVLTTMNERIEYLFDREHQIGHAYFVGCTTRADVDGVMRTKVLPLLAEYFYEDWSKVAAILGDAAPHEGGIQGGFLNRAVLHAPPGLEEDGEGTVRFRWSVRPDGFDYTKLALG